MKRSPLIVAAGLGLLVALAVWAGSPSPEAAQRQRPSVRITARYELPWVGSHARDVRWAGPNSVYVAWSKHGVEELEIGPRMPRKRQMVPTRQVFPRFSGFYHLAVSGDSLVFGGFAWNLAWRPLEKGAGGKVVFQRRGAGSVLDFDLQGDRFVLLGSPDTGSDPRPGILWLGTLSSGLKDLRALMNDDNADAGPTEHILYKCSALEPGAVHFLPDGSILAVPGFQPGGHLFSKTGQRLRSWTSQSLGITTDCSKITAGQSELLSTRPEHRIPWLNRHRIAEDILILPEGPGLVVRYRGDDRRTHWDLKVLRPEGGMASYSIPLADDRELVRLRGDARDGKIVFLLSESFPDAPRRDEILVADLVR